MNNTSDPIMLFDSEDEVNNCWVEAIVTEDEARDLCAPFCCDEDGESPYRPVGDASKQFLCPTDFYGEIWRYEKCDSSTKSAREFWSIAVY